MGKEGARARGPEPDGAEEEVFAAVVDKVAAWAPAERVCAPNAVGASHTSRGCPASKSAARIAARPSSVRVPLITRKSVNVEPMPPAINREDEDAWRRRHRTEWSGINDWLEPRNLRRIWPPGARFGARRKRWRLGLAKQVPGHRRVRMDR